MMIGRSRFARTTHPALMRSNTLVTVPSGHVGVLWNRFCGTVLDLRKLKDEGMRFLLPWNQVFLFDLRLQSATETYNALTFAFGLSDEAVAQLHQSIGPNCVQALLGPEIETIQVVASRSSHSQ
jgi:prohibitin 2